MTRHLPNWLIDWLGLPSGARADGAELRLESAWDLAPWATLLLLFGAAAAIAYIYAREAASAGRGYRSLLAALRLVAIGLLLVMIAQWAFSVRLTGPPTVALVIDRSASMGIADPYTGDELPDSVRERLAAIGFSEPTRINLAKLLTTDNDQQLLRKLSQRYRLNVYLVAADVEQLTAADTAELTERIRTLTTDAAGSEATRLGDALHHIIDASRGAPPAAIVLLSDGVTTAGVPLADAAQEARRSGVPILAVGLGSGQPPRDVEIADVLVEDAVFVDDLVSFQVQVQASGLEDESATVTLRREGDDTPLAAEQIELPPAGETLSVQLIDRPTTPGEHSYVIEIAPRGDETNPQNNREQRVVSVSDTKIRVLVVQAYPSYEFRFLQNLLQRDSTVQLDTYLQDADPEHAEQDRSALASLPVGRDELLSYDVLILGDVDPRLVPRSFWQHVRGFVAQKGGGAAFIAGPRFLPWLYADNPDVAALLPIDVGSLPPSVHNLLPREISGGFEVQPTPLGLQSPALQLGETSAETADIWRHLDQLYWLFQVHDLKPGAQIFAKSATPSPGPELPLILFQYVGGGRTLFHAIDSTWRWRSGSGDAYFARYWVQTVRFLARGKLSSGRGAQLSVDRREYRRGEAVQLRARFLDPRLAAGGDDVVVVLAAPGQKRRRVTLQRQPAVEGVFETSLVDLPPARYEAVLAEPQVPGNPPAARFNVVAPPGELARLEMDAAALAAAAETSRGEFYTIDNADQLLADLPAGRRVPVENLPPIPIWSRWWLLAAFLACITSEWILRKRKGML